MSLHIDILLLYNLIVISSRKTPKTKHLVRNDIILIAVLLIIPIVSLILYYSGQSNPEKDGFVVITVKGDFYDKLPLYEDTVLVIETNLGVNHIEIRDGQVKMTHADCPDQLCVNHKAISATGEQIVCLPNQVVVSIEGPEGNLDSFSE